MLQFTGSIFLKLCFFSLSKTIKIKNLFGALRRTFFVGASRAQALSKTNFPTTNSPQSRKLLFHIPLNCAMKWLFYEPACLNFAFLFIQLRFNYLFSKSALAVLRIAQESSSLYLRQSECASGSRQQVCGATLVLATLAANLVTPVCAALSTLSY